MTKNAKCVAIFVDFCKAFDSVSWSEIEAILYAYQVPTELVQAIMSIYHGTKAGLYDSEGQLFDENTFNLSIGVLQGDTQAPYLFVIVMDLILRSAMTDEYGILLKKKTGTARRGSPALYITELDFADDLVLLGSTIPKAQKLLNSLEKAALKVGLRINQSNTEYIFPCNNREYPPVQCYNMDNDQSPRKSLDGAYTKLLRYALNVSCEISIVFSPVW
jgi:hypothetical protein